MSKGHAYRDRIGGRFITTRTGTGGPTIVAKLQCSRCPTAGEVSARAILAANTLDKKFTARGWSLDPHRCPACVEAHRKEKKTVTSKPTPAAMRAQAQMIGLLSQHFDSAKGAFAKDWSDRRIAKETGIAPELVIEYRRNCFGELKEPAELRQIRDDINALEALQVEQNATMAQGIAELRGQLAKVSEKWAA